MINQKVSHYKIFDGSGGGGGAGCIAEEMDLKRTDNLNFLYRGSVAQKRDGAGFLQAARITAASNDDEIGRIRSHQEFIALQIIVTEYTDSVTPLEGS